MRRASAGDLPRVSTNQLSNLQATRLKGDQQKQSTGCFGCLSKRNAPKGDVCGELLVKKDADGDEKIQFYVLFYIILFIFFIFMSSFVFVRTQTRLSTMPSKRKRWRWILSTRAPMHLLMETTFLYRRTFTPTSSTTSTTWILSTHSKRKLPYSTASWKNPTPPRASAPAKRGMPCHVMRDIQSRRPRFAGPSPQRSFFLSVRTVRPSRTTPTD